MNYLVNAKSAYTMDDLKAYKSLEAYNQFVCGWVRDVMSMRVVNNVLVTARVRHSQRMNETALKPWVIADTSGVIHAAHCDCMAGLGEACSHVGSLLFYLEAASRINSSKTVTQEKAYWLLPSSIDKVTPDTIADIDFTSADTKKRRLDNEIDGFHSESRSATKLPVVTEPCLNQIDSFYGRCYNNGSNGSVLTVRAKYQKKFIPSILQEGKLPEPLVNLRDEKFLNMAEKDLKETCEQLFGTISVTNEQAENVELLTRDQSKCKEWHRLRNGRITASNMKSVCVGSLENPALSTVRSVCGTLRFKNSATEYGNKHEHDAIRDYTAVMKKNHKNFSVSSCGLFLNPKFPHLGATPDGIVSCDCCGTGLLEVKCPVNAKDLGVNDETVECLKDEKLKEKHRYAYQVQTQLSVTEKHYCDFVVWSKVNIHIERIKTKPHFEAEILTKSKAYFITVILPELTGGLVSRLKPRNETKNNENRNTPVIPLTKAVAPSDSAIQSVCICGKVCDKSQSVVRCDNENCLYGTLHFECVKVKRKPKSPYYCPECRNSVW